MGEYFAWHRRQRARLWQHQRDNETYVDDIKYLVVRCVETETCGGVSDRLKPLPFYLMVADLTRRVLLVHWRKPGALEHFLVPPPDGLDWRVAGTTATLAEIRSEATFWNGRGNGQSHGVRMLTGELPGWEDRVRSRVLSIRMEGGHEIVSANALFNMWRAAPHQRPLGLGSYLGWNGTVVNDHDLFEDVYRLLFTPSPEVERAIYDTLSKLDLLGREYAAAQVRAKHPKAFPQELEGELFRQFYNITMAAHRVNEAKRQMDFAEDTAVTERMRPYFLCAHTHAVACAARLAPGLPIYLASDSAIRRDAQRASRHQVRVGPFGTPLHVDCDCNQGRDPADFYLAFVDVEVMARALCLSWSGGLGAFAIRISGNKCTMDARESVCDSGNSTADVSSAVTLT